MLHELKLNPKNPRTISKKDFEALKKSIKEFPEMLEKRRIVYDETKTVLGGNMRLRALLELEAEGFEIKDDYFQSAEGWTEKQKMEFVIKDNVERGAWDDDVLANEWDDLPLEEWGIDTKGWDSEELIEDEAPEVSQEEPVSKLGEVYQLGRWIYCPKCKKKHHLS